MRTNEQIAQEVNKLIEKNNDACLGYKNAAENVNSAQLKTFFQKQAVNRNRYANELKQELQIIHPSAELNNTGSLKGDVHRGWMDIKAAFSSESDEEVLEECIRGEKACLEEYDEVLESVNKLPQSVCDTIQVQYREIRQTIDTVKRLEDLH